MPETRSGDEVDLLDSSIRTVTGALFVTVLYAISGIVYAAVTSPEEAGVYLFVTLAVALSVRPFSGVTRTLHKRGSEANEDVTSYFGLAAIVGAAYILVAVGLLLFFQDSLDRIPIINRALIFPIIAIFVAIITYSITSSLLAAVGYPGYKTWVRGGYQSLRYVFLIVFATQITTAADIIYVTAGARIIGATVTYAYLRVRPTLPSRDEIQRTVSFAKWSVPDQIIDRLSYNMPVYVLGVVAGPTAVGVYETADRFADFGASLAFYLSSPLLSKVSGDWSTGEATYSYLDGAATSGVGLTFVVLAYIAATSQIIAELVFPAQVRVFTITIIAVGCINVFRGVWTLLSHALEGVDRPGASVRTKIYGLLVSVPPTAFFGAEFGAVAGAAGYVLMNVVIGGSVLLYCERAFGRLPFDGRLAVKMLAASAVSYGVGLLAVTVLSPLFGGLIVAIVLAVVCLAVYAIVLSVLSVRVRRVIRRTGELYGPL